MGENILKNLSDISEFCGICRFEYEWLDYTYGLWNRYSFNISKKDDAVVRFTWLSQRDKMEMELKVDRDLKSTI